MKVAICVVYDDEMSGFPAGTELWINTQGELTDDDDSRWLMLFEDFTEAATYVESIEALDGEPACLEKISLVLI